MANNSKNKKKKTITTATTTNKGNNNSTQGMKLGISDKQRQKGTPTVFSNCDYYVWFILIEQCTICCNYLPNEFASVCSFPLL
jgi:hypothetical protein